MGKAPAVLKTSKPNKPWLERGDLRHDMAIVLGCPTVVEGRLSFVNIQLLAVDVLEHMQRIGGGLVVGKSLIRNLTDIYLLNCELAGMAPLEISHQDYTFVRFRIHKIDTRRIMTDPALGHRVLPGPIRVLTFWAVSRKIHIARTI